MPNAKSVAARGQRARGGFPAPNGRGVSNIPPDKRAYAEQMRARQDARRSGSRPTPVVGNTPPGAQNAPGRTPPVGQMAVLNGQPVMWKGDRWGTPPSEAMGVPEAVTAPRSRSGASGPPPRAPGGQAPVPEVRSGNSQQRISPVTGQPLGSTTGFGTATPASFTGAFDPTNPVQIDRDALVRAAYGNEGFTNKMNIQSEDFSKVLSDGLGGNANGFALAGNLLGAPAQPGFAAAANMAALVDPIATPEATGAGITGTPGVVEASFTPGINLAPSGSGATTQEAAAQDFANDAVNEVMSLQNQIRERRGMPLLVE